jgi:hypothetical protein
MSAWIKRKRKGQEAKMGNEATSLDGYSFGSKLEAAVYQMLKLRKLGGEIAEIQVQDHIYLTDARIGYIPDFKCTAPDGSVFWVEAKGYANDRWPMKKKLWKFYGPGPLEIWKGHYRNPKLDETVVPVTAKLKGE